MLFGQEYCEPHGPEYVGFWGPVTLTIDWCEENYVISPFFAEFVNSTTNLSFFILAMYHLRTLIKQRHGPLFIFISLGMALVGLGSWLFHMTLRYEFQLMDELPMIYVTLIPSLYIWAYGKSSLGKKLVYFGLLTFMFLLTFVYCFIYKNPIIHQICYAALNFAIIFRTLSIIRTIVPDSKTRWYLYKLLIASFSLFLFGFFVWNIDNELCSSLIYVRRKYLGIPFGFLIEGHGWWHIFTSLGIYHFILYIEVLVSWMEGVQENYYVNWRFNCIGQLLLKDQALEGIADHQGFGAKTKKE